MTRSELLLRMSSHEFAGWIAFYNREQREQERAQQIAEDKARAKQLSKTLRGLG